MRDVQEDLGTYNGTGGAKLAGLWKDTLDVVGSKGYFKYSGDNSRYDPKVEMLHAAFRNGYWDLGQQLFARLQRSNPENARYHFAWIALCQIQADKLPKDDKMASSLKMLASRSLKAVVDNSLAKKSTPKVLSSPSDLRLLCQVYKKQGMLAELVHVLDHPDIGITSDVGKNDVQFVQEKLDALTTLGRWKEIKDYCFDGLEKLYKHYKAASKITQEVPNELGWAVAWHPWKQALDAIKNIDGLSADDILKLAQQYLELDPHHRNAGNAILKHHLLYRKDALLASCQTFFEAHSTRVSCFDDLRQVVEGLSMEEKTTFCEFLVENATRKENGEDEKTQMRKVVTKVNAMKLRYLLHFSDMAAREDAEIGTFIAQCLEVYQSMMDLEDRPSDDACMLAITALMKFGSIKSNIYNLQAACLAHLLRDNSQYNFQATLLELLNSRILGLGSMTIAAFRDLRTQEVQLDTLGHLLYTRISTLHPWPVSTREVKALDDRFKDPKASIVHSLQYARRASDATLTLLSKKLEDVYFDKFDEFLNFNERIAKSFSSQQSRLELQHMRRLTDQGVTTNQIFSSYSFESSDNRDFSALMNFEPASASRSFRDIATGGHMPGNFWAARRQLNESVAAVLTSKLTVLTTGQIDTINSIFKYLRENDEMALHELTPTERSTSVPWDHLADLTFWLVRGPGTQEQPLDIKATASMLLDFLNSAKLAIDAEDMEIGADDRLEFTHASEFESWYLHLELAKTCSLFVTTAMAFSKQKGHHTASKGIPVDILNKIKTGAKALGDAVQKQAKTLQTDLKKDGKEKVLAVVKAGGLGSVIDQLIGESQVRMYVGEMVDSAVEGLEGVLKVKVA